MKRAAIFFLFSIVSASLFSQNIKRGIAYGHHFPEDMAQLSPSVGWWYNWAVEPESSVAEVYQDYGFEFVPMTWNGSFDEDKLRTFLANHPETKYLLAFNEPNFIEQAKMTPSEAAAQWPRLEAIAAEFNLEIVAPAVNFCGNCVTENGTTYTDPFEYLDDFFAACPDCQVDHIAVHSYMNTVAALQWYMEQFEKYNKPIWLTEFAGWEDNGNINSVDDQMNFLMGAVDYLESNPNIFRYSWFIGRLNGPGSYPYIDLLGAKGQLTALGEVYTQMPVHDPDQTIPVPGTIEAEAYNQMNGILIEKTADESGFANVGYIEEDDWIEYKIDVEATANYDLYFRVASTKNTSFKIVLDGEDALTQNLSNSNGWQNWITVSNTLELTEGQHTLRLVALNDGFNINWIGIGEDISTAAPSVRLGNSPFHVFPNPGNGIFHLQTTENFDQLQIIDLSGTLKLSLPFSTEIDLSNLSSGLYLVKAINQKSGQTGTTKLMIQ